jgi:hypothetical protein
MSMADEIWLYVVLTSWFDDDDDDDDDAVEYGGA